MTGERLDPELLAIAADTADTAYVVATTREQIPQMREQHLLAMRPGARSGRVERTDHLVPGDPPVRVRVHRRVGAEGPQPALVFMHPGGFIVGSCDDDDARHDRGAGQLGYVGIAVDYRLAPETPYPGPLDDCYAALRWVHETAEALGVDTTRVGIGGASAGGGLAAGLGLLARDRGEVPVAFQQLIYPMLDDRRITVTSSRAAFGWTPASNELGWSCYLGRRFGAEDVPAYAAPARATDLAGLPPTFVGVGALDLFCDEDIDYAQRLNHAGVPVELHVYPGAPHGFDLLAGRVGIAARFLRDQDEWLARQLAGG